MTNRRPPALLRGFGALLTTAVLLIGIPIGLAVLVGWPLPTSIPNGDTVTSALNTGITDTFIVKAIALIAWLAWAQLAVAFIAETVTAVRGRPSLRLPVAPGFQVAASRLVAGILMLAAPLQPARPAAAEAPTPVVATITQTPRDVVPSTPTPIYAEATDAAVTAPAQPVRETRTVTVERHDTYWEIAERELGDGLRWHEIQTLNVGRTMPDGHVIAPGDDTLRAGWTLDIATSDAQATAGGEIEVQAGDSLWTLSEHQLATDLGRAATDLEVAPYWTEVIDANHDRLADPTNPSLIHAGQAIAMPPTGRAAPPAVVEPAAPEPVPAVPGPVVVETQPDGTAEAPPEAPATSTMSTTVVTEEAEAEPATAAAPVVDDSDPDRADDGTPLPLIAVAGGLTSVALAVGAKRLLDRRRRERLVDHDKLPEPQLEQRQLHQTIVAMADEDLIGHLNYALGELAVAFADTGIASRPRVVRHSPESLEILLTDPAPIDVPGWRSDGDGRVLTLDHTINLDIDGPRCAAPLMVTIGQREEDANLYLDLEAEGIVALVGDVESARRLARSILTELTISPLAQNNRVVTIGDLVQPGAETLPCLTRLETWHDLTEDLDAWLASSHRALDLNAWPNAFVGRGHDPDHEALVPMVVVAAKPPPPDMLDDITGAFPSAVAVVVADEIDGARTTIHCDPDEVRLDDIALAFTPQRVDSDALEALGRAIVISELAEDEADDVDHREGFDLDDLDDLEGVDIEEEVIVAAVAETGGPPEYDVLVRLLGDIRIEGATKTVHPKATSVIAYLALNRSVTSERLEEACWFGSNGTSHRKRLRETMTICRDAIGSQHLPANENGTYTIGLRVRTDLDLFDWYVTQAEQQEPERAIESYKQALELVTGRPFTYPNKGRQSFGWVDFEHHATVWDGRLSMTAESLLDRCVAEGNPDIARDCLYSLLKAVPLNGGVVASLLRSLVRLGDRACASTVLDEYTSALRQAQLGEPDDEILMIAEGLFPRSNGAGGMY